jgi:hypothetical protein
MTPTPQPRIGYCDANIAIAKASKRHGSKKQGSKRKGPAILARPFLQKLTLPDS